MSELLAPGLGVGIIGYGAVAEIHAEALISYGARLIGVAGPNPRKAAEFASRHRIPFATSSEDALVDGVDAVVVASPNEFHASQAQRALSAGRHVLVEVPACSTLSEAKRLETVARSRSLTLRSADTALRTDAAAMLRSLLNGRETTGIAVIRRVETGHKSWNDDPLLHHGQHAISLIRDLTGGFGPQRSLVWRDGMHTAGRIPGEGFATITILYGKAPGFQRIIVATSEEIHESDGFTAGAGDPDAAYRSAVSDQDRSFLDAIRRGETTEGFQRAIADLEVIEQIRTLAASQA